MLGGVEGLPELIEAIDGLSLRLSLLVLFFFLAWISLLVGIIVAWFRSDSADVSEKRTALLNALVEAAEYERVIAECKSILSLSPNSLEAHWFIALAYYHSSSTDEALYHFNEVKRINPNWAESTAGYILALEGTTSLRNETKH